MNEFREAFRRPASDALSRTIRRDELGMFPFQLPEPSHQLVILTIGNLRVVLNIVKLDVAADLVAEFVDYLFDGCLLGQPVLVVPETLSESSLFGLSASERRGVVFDFAHCVSIINALFAIGTLVVFEIRHDIRDALIFIRPFRTLLILSLPQEGHVFTVIIGLAA